MTKHERDLRRHLAHVTRLLQELLYDVPDFDDGGNDHLDRKVRRAEERTKHLLEPVHER